MNWGCIYWWYPMFSMFDGRVLHQTNVKILGFKFFHKNALKPDILNKNVWEKFDHNLLESARLSSIVGNIQIKIVIDYWWHNWKILVYLRPYSLMLWSVECAVLYLYHVQALWKTDRYLYLVFVSITRCQIYL